jgi:hypothetical protein
MYRSSPVSQTALLSLTLFLCCTACSHQQTQREAYEDATSGIKFRTYKTASYATVGPAVKLYNSQQPDTVPPLKPAYAHLLLGYGLTISGKHALAFAEADLAQEEGDTTARYLAHSLRSITMYEQGWDSLAHEESQIAKQEVMLKPGTDVSYEIAIFYMLMGIMKAYEKDFAQSKFFWAGFANETGVHWPYKLTEAIEDLQNKRLQAALIKFKALSQDPAVPSAMRQSLAEQIALIEANAGDVNSRLFWPRLISGVILDQMKQSSNAQVAKAVQMVERLREKIE